MSVSDSLSSTSMNVEYTGFAKLSDVTSILDQLYADLEGKCLLPHERDALLERLKVYGRDPTNADPMFSKDGIEILTRHAFDGPSKTSAQNTLRCLANAMLLRPETRQMFVDLACEGKACSLLKDGSDDDGFLISRILFLTTYDTNIDLKKLVDDNHLGEIVTNRIAKYARQHNTRTERSKDPNAMEDMALTEILKLLFNLTHHCPERNSSFSQAIPHILAILLKFPLSKDEPLHAPIAQLINALINLDLEEKHSFNVLFSSSTSNLYTALFINYLDLSIIAYTDDEIEQLVSPLLTLLRKLFKIGTADVKKYMQRSLLPNDSDREEPVGRGNSLSARLLQLSTNPSVTQARESISLLLFELSNEDAQIFIRNVGYGFAAGFLFAHNVPVPEKALEMHSVSGSKGNFTKASEDTSKPINPVTGQTLASETKLEMPDMTQEQKEQEAEKLFVLFERLKKTGVASVINPVEQAVQQGRFEELEDHEESD